MIVINFILDYLFMFLSPFKSYFIIFDIDYNKFVNVLLVGLLICYIYNNFSILIVLILLFFIFKKISISNRLIKNILLFIIFFNVTYFINGYNIYYYFYNFIIGFVSYIIYVTYCIRFIR